MMNTVGLLFISVESVVAAWQPIPIAQDTVASEAVPQTSPPGSSPRLKDDLRCSSSPVRQAPTPRPGPRQTLLISESAPILPPSMAPSSSTHNGLSEDESDLEHDTDELARHRQIERHRILEAAGLVRKPRIRYPPPPPPTQSDRIPSAESQSSEPISSTYPFPPKLDVPSTSDANCSSSGQEHVDEEQTQDALTRYLRMQRELPSLSVEDDSAQSRARTSTRASRPVSTSISGIRSNQSRPMSTMSASTKSNHSRPLSMLSLAKSHHHSPVHSAATLGFRAWMSEVSRSVVAGASGHTTSSDKGRRISVSGPLPSSPDQTPLSGDTTVSFGSSWTSLMDGAVLSTYPEREKNRQEAIFELIKTEGAFVRNCQVLTEIFHRALAPILGSRASMVIFANIEEIIMFGVTFLSALEERQTEDRLLVGKIGDVICAHMQGLDVYRPYCTNQANATRVLNDLKSRNVEVREQLSSVKVKGLELEHFLLEPMQRLTRYPLLIKQIIKYTDEGLGEYELLQTALKKAEAVLTATNEAVREQENELKLAILSERLSIPGSDARLNLATPTRFVGRRRLIREGPVSKPRSRKTYHAYLFNDFFLLTMPTATTSPSIDHPQVMYRAPMPLEECQLDIGKDETSLIVIHRSEAITLRISGGQRARTAWIEDFRVARRTVYQALSAQRSKRASVPNASVWTRSSSSQSNDGRGNGSPTDEPLHSRFQKRSRSHHHLSSELPFSHRSDVSVGGQGKSNSNPTNDVDDVRESLRQFRIGEQPPSLPPLPKIHFNL